MEKDHVERALVSSRVFAKLMDAAYEKGTGFAKTEWLCHVYAEEDDSDCPNGTLYRAAKSFVSEWGYMPLEETREKVRRERGHCFPRGGFSALIDIIEESSAPGARFLAQKLQEAMWAGVFKGLDEQVQQAERLLTQNRL